MVCRYLAGALVSLSLAAQPAIAADWVGITTATDGTVVFIDASSVRTLPSDRIMRPFEVRQVWVKHDFSKVASEPARESKELNYVHCAGRKMALISKTSYRADGTSISSRDWPDYSPTYRPIIPDSVGEAILDWVCG